MDDVQDFDDILVPTDGSDSSTAGAKQAIRFAERNDATLHVLYAMDMGDADFVAVPSDIEETRTRLEKKGQNYVTEIQNMASDAGVPCETTVVSDTPVEAIRDYVDEHDIDLVVMGTHGRTGLDRYLLGSVTEKVVRLSDAPVLTVRLPADESS